MRNFAALSECDISCQVEGGGPPLVCLHPAAGVRVTPAIEKLMQDFTVYLPSCPGFDETKEPDAPLSIPRIAAWMAEFIETIVAAPVELSGQSFGGWIACWVAVQRPDLVRSLVLQCPIGFGPLHPTPVDAGAAALLARTYAHPDRRRPELKSEAVIARNRQLAARYSGGVVTDAELIERLHDLQARTLILYGRKDGIVPIDGMLRLEKTIPGSRLVLVEDAAHNIEVDQPDEYVRLVREFLAGESSTANGR